MDDTTRRTIAWECERLIRRFALLNDAHDHDALADMFTPAGSFARPSEPDSPVVGRETIRAFFASRPKRRTRHVMANTVVEVASETAATAHSYIVLYMGDRGETVLIGDFHDRFVRDDTGNWLFDFRQGSLAFVD